MAIIALLGAPWQRHSDMMVKPILAKSLALLLFSLLPPSLAYADETEGLSTPAGKCQNAFPNLISDIPWKTMFPIRIGGKKIIDMGDLPDNIDATVNTDDFNPSE